MTRNWIIITLSGGLLILIGVLVVMFTTGQKTETQQPPQQKQTQQNQTQPESGLTDAQQKYWKQLEEHRNLLKELDNKMVKVTSELEQSGGEAELVEQKGQELVNVMDDMIFFSDQAEMMTPPPEYKEFQQNYVGLMKEHAEIFQLYRNSIAGVTGPVSAEVDAKGAELERKIQRILQEADTLKKRSEQDKHDNI